MSQLSLFFKIADSNPLEVTGHVPRPPSLANSLRPSSLRLRPPTPTKNVIQPPPGGRSTGAAGLSPVTPEPASQPGMSVARQQLGPVTPEPASQPGMSVARQQLGPVTPEPASQPGMSVARQAGPQTAANTAGVASRKQQPQNLPLSADFVDPADIEKQYYTQRERLLKRDYMLEDISPYAQYGTMLASTQAANQLAAAPRLSRLPAGLAKVLAGYGAYTLLDAGLTGAKMTYDPQFRQNTIEHGPYRVDAYGRPYTAPLQSRLLQPGASIIAATAAGAEAIKRTAQNLVDRIRLGAADQPLPTAPPEFSQMRETGEADRQRNRAQTVDYPNF